MKQPTQGLFLGALAAAGLVAFAAAAIAANFRELASYVRIARSLNLR